MNETKAEAPALSVPDIPCIPQAPNDKTAIAQRLAPDDFPHPPRSGSQNPATTLENVEHLLSQSGISVRFDVIKKRLLFRRAGRDCTEVDVISLANLNGLNAGWLTTFLHTIGMRNPLNPVGEWIDSAPWDGIDRLPAIYATVRVAEDYPAELKETLLRRWFLSATAAATRRGRFHCRGVLTLQGPQGIGKTTWIASLMPAGDLRNQCIKRDHHMDGASKDSILGAISHWITEIGELDSSFRKDIARLKGFLTNDCDKVRPPYGRVELEYDRRTVFAATVNEGQFLVDATGNTRFWTIAVQSLDYLHTVDMQQLFAQLRGLLDQGEQWWLTAEEEKALEGYNLRHRSVSAIAERILDHVATDAPAGVGGYVTATELLREIGVSNPTNPQTKEAGTLLRELFGSPKRVQGRDRWRVPTKEAFERYKKEEEKFGVIDSQTGEDRFG